MLAYAVLVFTGWMNDREKITLIQPNGEELIVKDKATFGEAVAYLNELGRKGWEVVSQQELSWTLVRRLGPNEVKK